MKRRLKPRVENPQLKPSCRLRSMKLTLRWTMNRKCLKVPIACLKSSMALSRARSSWRHSAMSTRKTTKGTASKSILPKRRGNRGRKRLRSSLMVQRSFPLIIPRSRCLLRPRKRKTSTSHLNRARSRCLLMHFRLVLITSAMRSQVPRLLDLRRVRHRLLNLLSLSKKAPHRSRRPSSSRSLP